MSDSDLFSLDGTAAAQPAQPGTAAEDPSVRLAWFSLPAVDTALAAPTVRLAHKEAQGDGTLTGDGYGGQSVPQISPRHAPPLLVSYFYLAPFLEQQKSYMYRDWVMDSGAFSAHNSGAAIDLSQYIDKCLELMETDPTLTEVFALDQIPASHSEADLAKATEKSINNTEEMWRQGVPAIPCYHVGEPEEALLHIAKAYPKIALGGMVKKGGGSMPQDEKFFWLEQCFARVWPKRIHGFGVSAERMVYGLPFHSVDATNWEIGPCAFGNWQRFGSMSVRGSNQDLRTQVWHYLDMEAKARARWVKEMAMLEALPDKWPQRLSPSVRLAVRAKLDADADARVKEALAAPGVKAKGKNGNGPTVRLVANGKPGRENAKTQALGGTATATPPPAPQQEKPKEPPQMDDKWVDYWKNRL